MFQRNGPFERRKTYAASVVSLIGHLLGTAVIFVSFFAIGWGASYLLYFLHRVHPFPDEILFFITKFELYLVYADSVLCTFMILGGAYRFATEFIEGIK
jgi:hypothetical protein